MEGFGYEDTLETSWGRVVAVALSLAAFLGGLLAVGAVVVVDQALIGPTQRHDGTCIGGRTPWAVLLLGTAWCATAAALWALLRAVGGRAPHAQLALFAVIAGLGRLFVTWAPDAAAC